MPEIVIVHPVDLPVDLVRPRTVQRAEATNVITAKTRCNRNHLREVPPVQRHVLHHVVGNRHGLGLRGGIERQRSRGNFHGGGLLLKLQLHL